MEFIDIHTHSPRSSGKFVMNVFAQDLVEYYHPAGLITIGLHPWHLLDVDPEQALQQMGKWAEDRAVIGIGECGLDKNISTDLNLQEQIFLQQLEISETCGKPAIIHCVKAYSEMLHWRKSRKWTMPWIFHWFNASREVAADLIRFGCYLSFGRSLLHPSGKNALVLQELPLSHVFLETDDAQITIEDVYAKAASMKGIEIDSLKEIINRNFETVFSHGRES